MVKGSGHTNDRETAFDNPSKMQPKRPHQWFVDGAEVEFFPNKKQAVEDANGKSSSGFSSVSISPWENNPNFPSVPNIGQLFGSETRQVNFIEKNASYVPADDRNVRSNMITNQYVDNASFGLSISHSVEDPEARRNVRGRKKVKVNRVKDSNGVRRPEGQNSNRQSNGDLHQAYGGEVEPRSASIGQAFGKDGNVTLMGLTYNRGDVTSPAADNGQLYNQSSAHVLTTGHEKELDASNSDAAASPPKAAKVKSETVSKNKQESKATKKEAPNSFPTNVRSLISTGILDGVPVKYVSVAREELRGIIKGSGYRCGCQKCNYSKALNAYEFERHAGCKSKHPNNHIYFENGKTIYQIVQELKSTPESLLFDTIQTVFGSPINQKAFRYWKESYQAATRELQRIYGKEELNV